MEEYPPKFLFKEVLLLKFNFYCLSNNLFSAQILGNEASVFKKYFKAMVFRNTANQSRIKRTRDTIGT